MVSSCCSCSIGEAFFPNHPSRKENCQLALVTTVALTAIGAMLLSLYCILNPTGVVANGIGTIGAYSMMGAGGAVFIITIALMLCSQKKHAKPLSKEVANLQETTIIEKAPEKEKEEELSPIEQFKKEFKENALRLLGEKKIDHAEKPLTFDKSCLEEAMPRFRRRTLKSEWGITRHSGGEHHVFELKGVEGVIFKVHKETPEASKHAEEYVELRRKGRELCETERLFLIRVPSCTYVEIEGKYVIVEEKIEDVYGDFTFQKGMYQWGLQQEDLRGYFHELFRQMLVFVCKFKFGDFKYNNVPLSLGGQVIFLDLDDWGAVLGLVRGSAATMEGNGLLNYLPKEWFNKFVLEAKKLLQPKDIELLDTYLTAIEERAEKKAQKRKDYQEFLSEKGITKAADPIALDSVTFNDTNPNEITQILAEIFVHDLNTSLEGSLNLDPLIGRRMTLDLTIHGNLWRGMSREKKETVAKFTSFRNKSGKGLLNNVTSTLTALQTAGVIHRFKYVERATTATVWC